MTDKDWKEIAESFMKMILRFFYEFQESPLSFGKFKVSSLSFGILFRLYTCENNTMTILELSERMQISKPQLTKLLNKLEDENMVTRERYRENRRIVYLTLSENGLDHMNQVLDMMENSFIEKIKENNSEKKKMFIEGIQKIEAALKHDEAG